jgi:hypothetical protein
LVLKQLVTPLVSGNPPMSWSPILSDSAGAAMPARAWNEALVPKRATMSRAFAGCCLIAFAAAFPFAAFAQTPASGSPPAATAPEAAKPRAGAETPAVVVDGSTVETLLGKLVQSANGEDFGRIVDVIVDHTGMMRAAIIDFGGFLGVGTRKIAVDWHALHFPPNGGMDELVADLARDQLRKAPAFKEGEPVVIIGATEVASSGSPASPPSAPASSPQAPATPAEAGSPPPKP